MYKITKSLGFALTIFILVSGCSKNTSTSEDSKLFGLASPIQLVGDTTVVVIADYFEIYFPIKSSNGLEIKSPNYNEKIRFLFTFEPDVLLGLFRRKWY